jgi:hypothetical protein
MTSWRLQGGLDDGSGFRKVMIVRAPRKFLAGNFGSLMA